MAAVKKHKRQPACTECRRKKIGCDRAQPECANCLKTGRFKCQYPATTGGTITASSVKSSSMSGTQSNNNNKHSQPYQRQVNMTDVTPTITTTIPKSNEINTSSIASNSNISSMNTTLRLKNYNNQMREYYANNNNSTNIATSVPNNLNRNTSTKSMRKMIDQITRQSLPTTNINELTNTSNYINSNSYQNQPNHIYRSSTVDDENELLNQLVNNYPELDFNVTSDIDVDNRIVLLNHKALNIPEVMNPYEFNNIYKMIPTDDNGDEDITRNYYENTDESNKNNNALVLSNYSQEEILLQEMDFLKDRFKELQHFRQQRLLSNNNKRSKDSELGTATKASINHKVTKNKIVEKVIMKNPILSVKSQFILFNPQENPVDLMKYFHNDTNQNNNISLNYILKLKQNFKFNIKSVIYYDKYIFNFYQDLINLMDKKFPIRNISKERQLQRLPILNNTLSYNKIKILESESLYTILKFLESNLYDDLAQLVPILHFNREIWQTELKEILEVVSYEVDHSATEIESLIPVKSFNTKQLSFLGIFIIITVLTYLYLHTTSNLILKEEMKPLYDEIRVHLPNLHESLFYIQNEFTRLTNTTCYNELENKISIENNIAKLKFLAILQWYCNNFKQSMELINLFFHTDNDIDIKFAEKVKFDMCKDNNTIIEIWQFIEKQYIHKKLFDGQYPTLINDKIFNNSILNNELINYDLDITKKELKIMEYLFNKQIFKINELYYQLSTLEKSFNQLNTHKKESLKENENVTSMINANVKFYNEQIYYQMNLFVRFYLLLQLEQLYNMEYYQIEFNKLLKDFITPILLRQLRLLKGKSLSFNNRNDKTKIDCQYLFIDKTSCVIDNIIDIFFSIYERIDQAYSLQKDLSINTNPASIELKQLNLILQTITQLFVIISITLSKLNGISKPVIIVINKLKIYLSYMIKRNMRHINENSFITSNSNPTNQNSNVNAFNNLHITQITNIQIRIHNLLNQSIDLVQIESHELKEFVKENIISKEILEYNINNRNFKIVYEAFFM